MAYDNTIEGQLDLVLSTTQMIHSLVDRPDNSQKDVNGSLFLLAREVNKLARIVQLVASKQNIMANETTF
jgi:hypothetical protein